MAKQDGPMGPKELAALNKLIASCAETKAYCEKCRAAHLDVSQELASNEEQSRIAQALKAQFFPREV